MRELVREHPVALDCRFYRVRQLGGDRQPPSTRMAARAVQCHEADGRPKLPLRRSIGPHTRLAQSLSSLSNDAELARATMLRLLM